MKASRKAYQVIINEIIEGRCAPGDRITEAAIAEQARVSRTPVREALQRLEAEGMIRFVPNQGAFVTHLALAEAEETFALRMLLEGYATRLAARRASTAQVQSLEDLATRQLAASQRREKGFLRKVADYNQRFHELILNAAGSELLKTTMSSLSNAPLVFQTFRDYSTEDLIRSAQHHLEIAQAIGAGDPDWAESVMRAHVAAARQAFESRRGAHHAPSGA